MVPRFRVGPGRLDYAVLMLGRGVERVEFERLIAGVADIVACRNPMLQVQLR